MSLPLRGGRPGIALLLGMAGVTGCIPYPSDHRSTGSRDNVSAETLRFVKPGSTTRAQVALSLGEPDRLTPDESQYIYRRTRDTVRGQPLCTSGPCNPVPLKQATTLFTVQFDRAGRVVGVSEAQSSESSLIGHPAAPP